MPTELSAIVSNHGKTKRKILGYCSDDPDYVLSQTYQKYVIARYREIPWPINSRDENESTGCLVIRKPKIYPGMSVDWGYGSLVSTGVFEKTALTLQSNIDGLIPPEIAFREAISRATAQCDGHNMYSCLPGWELHEPGTDSLEQPGTAKKMEKKIEQLKEIARVCFGIEVVTPRNLVDMMEGKSVEKILEEWEEKVQHLKPLFDNIKILCPHVYRKTAYLTSKYKKALADERLHPERIAAFNTYLRLIENGLGRLETLGKMPDIVENQPSRYRRFTGEFDTIGADLYFLDGGNNFDATRIVQALMPYKNDILVTVEWESIIYVSAKPGCKLNFKEVKASLKNADPDELSIEHKKVRAFWD